MQTNKSGVKVRQHPHAKSSTIRRRDDASITESEYERGTRIAGWMLCAMFLVMTIKVVVSSWC